MAVIFLSRSRSISAEFLQTRLSVVKSVKFEQSQGLDGRLKFSTSLILPVDSSYILIFKIPWDVKIVLNFEIGVRGDAKIFKFVNAFLVPVQTLYIKNLSPRVGEGDLSSLFSRFQKLSEPEIVYKLMTGRMKGQAFVTFPGIVFT